MTLRVTLAVEAWFQLAWAFGIMGAVPARVPHMLNVSVADTACR